MADGTFTTTRGTRTHAGTGGIAAKTKAATAQAEAAAEDLAEARRLAAAATYGGEEAWSRMPSARRRDLLVDAWLLMHAPAQERAEREKRQRAAGVEPASVPLESTLKNYWRNERERAGRQGKILAFGYAITAAAVAGEAAERGDATRPRPVLAEFAAPAFAQREQSIGDAS